MDFFRRARATAKQGYPFDGLDSAETKDARRKIDKFTSLFYFVSKRK